MSRWGTCTRSRGLCRGYLGELDEARADFFHAIALASAAGDPETVAAAHANLALLEASIGDHQAALDLAARGSLAAEQAANVVHLIACSVPAAVAAAGVGRFEAALALAETNLASVRQRRVGLYFEPVLLATIARSKLALDEPDDALAAAEEAVAIADARGLGTCALAAPITLAQVLSATQGVAAADRIDSLLAHALDRARETGASAFEPQIHRELAALARLRGDEIDSPGTVLTQ